MIYACHACIGGCRTLAIPLSGYPRPTKCPLDRPGVDWQQVRETAANHTEATGRDFTSNAIKILESELRSRAHIVRAYEVNPHNQAVSEFTAKEAKLVIQDLEQAISKLREINQNAIRRKVK